MKLRKYQYEAVSAVWAYIRSSQGNPCVVVPTGGGKTPILSQLCVDALNWGGRVIVMAHVKELLSQAVNTLSEMPELSGKFGLYSSGLKSKDEKNQIIIAGIQSVYSKADKVGRFDIMIIDEAHLVPVEGDGMYRQFIKDALVINPKLRIVGLTATPYRMKGGLICKPDNYLNEICYEIGVKDLIDQGYLCPLTAKAGTKHVDTSTLKITAGEFNHKEEQSLFDKVIESACIDIINKTIGRKSILVFSSSIKHAIEIKTILASRFFEGRIECVFGDTDYELRDEYTRLFKAGEIRGLINVNCLTTGFDAPNVDCIALLRATVSPGLYYQIVGRGLRICEGKIDCLILDFGNNVLRHGPIDQIVIHEKLSDKRGEASGKECPGCGELVACSVKECPECGHVFQSLPSDEDRHERKASDLEPISKPEEPDRFEVEDIFFAVHEKRGAAPDHPKTMKVTYYLEYMRQVCEYVCIEHQGYALGKAKAWWKMHTCDRFPDSAQDAVDILSGGGMAKIKSITVLREGKFDRIVSREIYKNMEMAEVGIGRDIEGVVPF